MPDPDEVDATVAAADREPDYRFTLANERTFLAWAGDHYQRCSQ